MRNHKCEHCGKFCSYKGLDSYIPFGYNHEDLDPLPPIIICQRCSEKLKKKFIEQFNRGDYSGDYKKSHAEIEAANECNLKWIGNHSSIVYKGKRICYQYIPKQYLYSDNSIKDPTILENIPNKVYEDILKIVSRVKKYSSTWSRILQLELSLSLALHYQKGYFDTALDHRRLMTCDKFHLLHDVYGVYNNIDTVTGKLKNHFVPRITLPIEDYNKFDSLEDYQRYLQEGNPIKDIVTISGVIFTMDYYDIDGNEVTYRNKKEENAFRIITKDRYKHGYKNAELEYFTPIYFRNDINYAE